MRNWDSRRVSTASGSERGSCNGPLTEATLATARGTVMPPPVMVVAGDWSLAKIVAIRELAAQQIHKTVASQPTLCLECTQSNQLRFTGGLDAVAV